MFSNTSMGDTMGKNASSKFTSMSQFDRNTAQILGEGGFGTVKAMKCYVDGQVYAVKIVKIASIIDKADEFVNPDKMKKMIFGEARVLRYLDHDNIVKVYGSFLDGDEDKGIFHIVMEFCAGGSLRQIIRQAQEDLDEHRIVDWSSQIIDGLKYLHSKDILHRDIKADNILLDSNHQFIKIGDFGISKISNKKILSARTAVGSPFHMPPEVIKDQSYEWHWQSDVWSLGIVIFHLCARRLPFRTGSAILCDPIPSIPERYSQQLKQILESRILVRDPKKRATPEQLSKELPFVDHFRQSDKHFRLEEENQILQRQVQELSKKIAEEQQKNETLQRQIAELVNGQRRLELMIPKIGSLPAPVAVKGPLKADARLVNAAEKGNFEEVVALLAAGADVNGSKSENYGSNKHGETALMKASQNGHYIVVSQLLANKAEVNSQNRNGETALVMAVSNGHIQVVKQLLSQNAEVSKPTKDGWTALMLASKNGNDTVVSHLLAARAGVNSQNQDGFTALMLAAKAGHHKVVSQLLPNEADVNIQNQDENTSLILAAESGHHKVVSLLLAYDAEIDKRNKDGETALMKASKNGHDKVAIQLLANNADLNCQSRDGYTALMFAARESREKIVTKLLAHKAEFDCRNEDGSTALMLAAWRGHDKVVSQLLANNALVDNQDRYGFTALMLAARHGSNKVGSLLLQKNAYVHLKNEKGDSALALAGNHSAICDMLIAKGAT